MQLFLNGASISADMNDSLSRALVISLFTWRRADTGDDIDDEQSKQGWWGDTFSEIKGDRIGSKLWQLTRKTINQDVIKQAIEFTEQALNWMIEDNICSDIEVSAEKSDEDFNRLDVSIKLTTTNGEVKNYSIKDLLNVND